MLLISYLGVSGLTLILLVKVVEDTIDKLKENRFIEKNDLHPKELTLFNGYIELTLISFIPLINTIILAFLIACMISGQGQMLISALINKIDNKVRNRKERK